MKFLFLVIPIGMLLGLGYILIGMYDYSYAKNYHIVKFQNGQYALRRGYLNYYYKDLKGKKYNIQKYWWDTDSMFYPDTKGTLEEIKDIKQHLESSVTEEEKSEVVE